MDTPIPAKPASARERLLTAAEELFYAEGIGNVGIDRIIEHAGVAKASLYDVFGSKEALVQAYLAGRFERRKARILDRLGRHRAPRERLLAVFDAAGELMADPGFRGCPFSLARAQTKPTSSARNICDESRAWTFELFHQLAREAGAAHPKKLAHQLVILYDGATTSAQMDSNPQAAAIARAMAAALLESEAK
jgi:AcrR family transcriptional regulator